MVRRAGLIPWLSSGRRPGGSSEGREQADDSEAEEDILNEEEDGARSPASVSIDSSRLGQVRPIKLSLLGPMQLGLAASSLGFLPQGVHESSFPRRWRSPDLPMPDSQPIAFLPSPSPSNARAGSVAAWSGDRFGDQTGASVTGRQVLLDSFAKSDEIAIFPDLISDSIRSVAARNTLIESLSRADGLPDFPDFLSDSALLAAAGRRAREFSQERMAASRAAAGNEVLESLSRADELPDFPDFLSDSALFAAAGRRARESFSQVDEVTKTPFGVANGAGRPRATAPTKAASAVAERPDKELRATAPTRAASAVAELPDQEPRATAPTRAASAVAERHDKERPITYGDLSPDDAAGLKAKLGGELPEALKQQIPRSDEEVLRALLAFLEFQGLGYIPVFVGGGYVRDLFLGREPEDLDLSLWLKGFSEEVTISSLFEQLPEFVTTRPEFSISGVKFATTLSDRSKDKQIDTVKAIFETKTGKMVEVDLMPTIGEEVYANENRIPIRDHRGEPEQDALRRDLTIGAILLQVTSSKREPGGLRYELLDFYGGVEDIKNGILRAPYPFFRTLQEVRKEAILTDADEILAKELGLDDRPEDEAMQAFWWAKALRDDPLRICRALRFASMLRFTLHESFWVAVPFAMEALRSKVSGKRKTTEYLKTGSYGAETATAFLELAFGRTFGPNGDLRLAPALFSGQDEMGRQKGLAKVKEFDMKAFRSMASELSLVHDEGVLIGTLLAVAIAASELEGGAKRHSHEFSYVCDGLCVSRAVRDSGRDLLSMTERLANDPPPPGLLENAFAAACGVNASAFGLYVQVWGVLPLGASRRRLPASEIRPENLVIKLLGDSPRAVAVHQATEVLAFQRPPITGGIWSEVELKAVPAKMRGQVMSLFAVALRLLRYDQPVESEQQVLALFKEHPKLRDAVSPDIWFEEDGKTLRQEFEAWNKRRTYEV